MFDLNEARYVGNPAYETIRAALRHYRAGDVTSALADLESLATHDRQVRLLRAALLLSVGRVDEAQSDLQPLLRSRPKSAGSLAMQAIIEIAHNDKKQALELSTGAVQIDNRSPVGYRALSYAQQTEFNLEQALANSRKALELGGNNANDWARVAELHLMLGQQRQAKEAAEQAVALQPDSSLVRTVQGFTLLQWGDATQAKRIFQQAIAADSSAPLPRFGLGLAKIREGDLDGGTEDISIATALGPNDSLMRSYLGKAYYEQKRNKLSETQYGLAKQLDPKDPTPWFYDAIKKQTENRPVEALQDMQKAIELNGNRAVYRSRQLLDDDLAARSAALGRIYNDLGFGQRALVEGWNSVSSDPGNYSGHRFLSDSYAALPRHEIARVSELLQSQLRQPLNITPVQPQLGESNLLIVSGAGPTMPGFNEFNPLFARNRFALQTSGVVGSNDSYGDEVVQSGLWNNASYSLGQFHYQTNGFRKNNDLNQNVYNAFVQGSLSPSFSVQAEARHRELEHGDLTLNAFDLQPVNRTFNPDFRRNLRTDTLRVGAHYAPAPHSDFIASVLYQDQNELQNFSGCPPLCFKDNLHDTAYLAEAQYLFSAERLNLTLGGGNFGLSKPERRGPTAKEPPSRGSAQHGNAYGYANIRLPAQFTWILGVSYDSLTDTGLGNFSRVNPKIGLMWQALPGTTIRAAGFRTLKRSLLTDQTIEPTQVAGFNQFFDDKNGTESKRYGIALDQRFSPDLFAGAEISRRQLDVPQADGPRLHWKETLYRAYLNWAVSTDISASLSYQLEEFRNNARDTQIPDTTTHMAPLSLRYFHPSGLFGRIGATFVNQQVTANAATKEQDQFVLVDVGIGFRFPRRLGIMSLNVNNMFNRRFTYQGLGLRTLQEESQPFQPDRTIVAQVTLSF